MNKLLIIFIISLEYLYGSTFLVSNTTEFRKALNNAALNFQDDTIILKKGIYKTTDDGIGSFAFNSKEENSLSIKSDYDLNANDVVMSGDKTDSIFRFSADKTNLYLKGITFEDGYNSYLYVRSKLDIDGCIFKNNTSDSNLYYANNYLIKVDNNSNFTGFHDIKIKNSSFLNNSYSRELISIHSAKKVTFSDNSFTNNSGELYILSTPQLVFQNNIVKDHNKTSFINTGTSDTNISSSIFDGGTIALEFRGLGDHYISDSTFKNFSSFAIKRHKYSRVFTNTYLNNSLIENCGGGVSTAYGQLEVKNSILKNNVIKDTQHYLLGAFGKIKILNSEITDNTVLLNNDINNLGMLIQGYQDTQLSCIIINSIFKNNKSINLSLIKIDEKSLILNSTFQDNNTSVFYGHGQFFNNIFQNNQTDIYFLKNYTKSSNIINNYLDISNSLGLETANVTRKGNFHGNTDVVNANSKIISDTQVINAGLSYDDEIFKLIYDSYSLIKLVSLSSIKNLVESDKNGNKRYTNDLGAYNFKVYNEDECIDVPMYAKNPITDGWVKILSSCDVPDGWEISYAKPLSLKKFDNASRLNINTLSPGWHLLGTTNPIYGFEKFLDSEIVWAYINGEWKAFSYDLQIQQKMKKKNIEILNTIPANTGFWIKK